MIRLTTTLVALVLFTRFAGLPALAQSPDSTSSAKPATTDSNASAAGADKKKPKKVWTNDEIGKISGGISVVGDAKSSATADSRKNSGGASPNEEARQLQIETYRKQLNDLQAQIDAMDKRISHLKNFKGDNTAPSGGINMNQGYNMVPVEDQVKQLEDKKKRLQAKMDDLVSEAHKRGITSEDLR